MWGCSKTHQPNVPLILLIFNLSILIRALQKVMDSALGPNRSRFHQQLTVSLKKKVSKDRDRVRIISFPERLTLQYRTLTGLRRHRRGLTRSEHGKISTSSNLPLMWMWYIDNTLIDLESGPGLQDLESSHQPGEWLVPPPLPPHPRLAGGRSPTPTSSASSLLWTSNLNRTFKVEAVQLFLYIYYILELFPAGDGQARLTPWITSRLTTKGDSGAAVLHCSPTEELLPTRAHLTTLFRARERILAVGAWF